MAYIIISISSDSVDASLSPLDLQGYHVLFRFNVTHRWATDEDHERTMNAARPLEGRQPWFYASTNYGPYYICFSPYSIQLTISAARTFFSNTELVEVGPSVRD
jgi:hypothetical protein